MKKLLITLVALVAVYAAKGQDLAQIAKQQITEKIKLPIIIRLLGAEVVTDKSWDSIALQLTVKPNGRIKTVDLRHSSQPAVNELFITTIKNKVRLPTNDAENYSLITLNFKLLFQQIDNKGNAVYSSSDNSNKLHYSPSDASPGPSVSYNGETSYSVSKGAKKFIYDKERSSIPMDNSALSSQLYNESMQRMNMQINTTKPIRSSSPGLPLFMVTIAK